MSAPGPPIAGPPDGGGDGTGDPNRPWDPSTAEPWPSLIGPDDVPEPTAVRSVPSSSRNGRRVRLVVVHTAEGARTATSLRDFFVRTQNASSHVAIDAGQILRLVDDDRSAWTVRSGNPISVNAELCAFASFSRAQWLSTAPVAGCASPRAILNRTALWIRESCARHRLPIRKLTPAQVHAGQAGVCGHIDWTTGMSDGSHTDPGAGFPWDIVMDLATTGPEEEFLSALSDDQQRALFANVDLLTKVVATRYPSTAVNGEMKGNTWLGDTGETVRAVLGALTRIERRLDALEQQR